MEYRTTLIVATGLGFFCFVCVAGCGNDAEDCNLALTCPSYARAQTVDDGGTPRPECAVSPSASGGVVDPSCGVFAAPGAAGGDGSLESPLGSLQAAIEVAAAANKPVYACEGAFSEAIRVPTGLLVFGGLDCQKGWTWAAGHRTKVSAPAAATAPSGTEVAARLLSGKGKTVIEDLDIEAPDGLLPGVSSVALLVEDTTAELHRVSLSAGDGHDGSAGAHLADDPSLAGLDGQSGYAICGATAVNPGPAGPEKSCGAAASRGGKGGDGGSPLGGEGGDGGDGLPQSTMTPPTGLGGAGQSVASCEVGQKGEEGAPGEAGEGAPGKGTLTLDGYHGEAGGDGGRGAPGQGGGGGGGSRGKMQVACLGQATLDRAGATGGSGGSGGCGGLGGIGGMAGGSSMALVSLSKQAITLVEVALRVGRGGKGGEGGAGQNGGGPGFGESGGQGSGPAAIGCHGGDGGAGGVGGPGGGGAGGHAIAIAYRGVAPKGSTTVTHAAGSPSPGEGGAPGQSGPVIATAGVAGLAGDAVDFGP